jgi:hypothetical protein
MAVLRNREPLYRTGFYKDPNLNYYIHYYAEFILKTVNRAVDLRDCEKVAKP